MFEQYNNEKISVLYFRSDWVNTCLKTDEIMDNIKSDQEVGDKVNVHVLNFDDNKDKLIQLNIRINPLIIVLKYGKIVSTLTDIFSFHQTKCFIKDNL